MTVPDGAPKHIEWGDRIAQELAVLGASKIILMRIVNSRPEEYKQSMVEETFARLGTAMKNLDKVRDEIANSENLEEELHELIESINGWAGSKVFPATLVHRAQSAQRVLDRIVHVEEPSGG